MEKSERMWRWRIAQQWQALPDCPFARAETKLTEVLFLSPNPLARALGYLLERWTGPGVYLADPEVPIDANRLERALRVIYLGKTRIDYQVKPNRVSLI